MILLKTEIQIIWLIIGSKMESSHIAPGPGSRERSFVSLKHWSLSDFSFAKTLESSCGVRHVLGENPRAVQLRCLLM